MNSHNSLNTSPVRTGEKSLGNFSLTWKLFSYRFSRRIWKIEVRVLNEHDTHTTSHAGLLQIAMPQHGHCNTSGLNQIPALMNRITDPIWVNVMGSTVSESDTLSSKEYVYSFCCEAGMHAFLWLAGDVQQFQYMAGESSTESWPRQDETIRNPMAPDPPLITD